MYMYMWIRQVSIMARLCVYGYGLHSRSRVRNRLSLGLRSKLRQTCTGTILAYLIEFGLVSLRRPKLLNCPSSCLNIGRIMRPLRLDAGWTSQEVPEVQIVRSQVAQMSCKNVGYVQEKAMDGWMRSTKNGLSDIEILFKILFPIFSLLGGGPC